MSQLHVRVLASIGRFSCRRRVAVLAAAALLTALSWLPILFSGVDQAFNVARLLPQDIPAARDFTRVVTDFGSTDEGVIVLRLGGSDERGDGPEARERRRALAFSPSGLPGPAGVFADDVVRRLKADGEIAFRDVYCRKFTPADRDYLRYEALADGGLLLLEPEEVERVALALRPERIENAVRSFARFRRNVGRSTEATLAMVQFDSLGLRPLFKTVLARLQSDASGGTDSKTKTAGGAEQVEEVEENADAADATDAVEADADANLDADAAGDDAAFLSGRGPGYLLDPDARLLLIIYQPEQPAQKLEYAKAVTEAVRRAVSAARENLTDDARRRIGVEFSGGYEIAVLHEKNVYVALRDTFLSTLAGVLLIFGFAYRRPGVFLYVGLPLVVIVSWTVGLGFLLFGRLNMISCAFAAVLVSLGVDYAVHIYNRYAEERQRGMEVEEAFARALAHTGWGVVMGMVTTAAAFLALLGTRFSQLTEFGLLVGLGLTLAVPVMFFVLPALIATRNHRRAEHARAARPMLFGLPWVERRVAACPRLLAAGGLALAAGAGAAIFLFGDRMRFDERIDPLRPPMRAIDIGAEVARAFSNRSGGSLMIVAYSGRPGREGEEDALDRAGAQREACRRLMAESVNGRPALLDYESLLRFLPPPSTQRRTLALLAEIDWDAAVDAFRRAAAAAMPDEYFGIEQDGRPAAALSLSWSALEKELALDREADEAAAVRDGLGAPARARRADEFRRLQREWLAYTFPLKLLTRHRERVAAGRPLLVSDFAETPLARYIARLAATRKREVDFREPLPEDLAFPATLAVDAETRDGRVAAKAGTAFASAEALRALYDAPGLERPDQVRRAVLAVPGWAIKTKLYPPIDPTTRAGDPLLGSDWVELARQRFDAPITGRNGTTGPNGQNGENGGVGAPDAVLTGIPLLAHELAEIVKEDFRRLSIWVLAGAVAALGWFFRRHPVRALASLAPIVLGMLYLFGFMALAGIRINFVNVLAIPILIGLGVDAGIHVVERYFESGRSLNATVVGTGRAILITGLTSMVGFGSLGLGAYGGAAGMGWLMIAGLVFSMLVSLFALPSLLRWLAPPPAEAPDSPSTDEDEKA